MFQDQERTYFHKFDNRVLSAKAGSLFLWDSRLAHQNLLPGKGFGLHNKTYCQVRDLGVSATVMYMRAICSLSLNVEPLVAKFLGPSLKSNPYKRSSVGTSRKALDVSNWHMSSNVLQCMCKQKKGGHQLLTQQLVSHLFTPVCTHVCFRCNYSKTWTGPWST